MDETALPPLGGCGVHRGGWRVVPDQGRGQDHECNAERTSPDGVITGCGGALGQDLSA
jgi:hypothetical protein